MIRIKKVLSTLLTASMACSYAVSVSAANDVSISVLKPNPGYMVDVTIDGGQVTDQTVTWYKLNTQTQNYEQIEDALGDKWSITNACANSSVKACVDGIFSNVIEVGAAADKPVTYDKPADQPDLVSNDDIFSISGSTLPLVLLDSEEIGGRKQYLIFTKSIIGKGIFYYGDATRTKFDPEDPNCIGYWLNNEYLQKDKPARDGKTVTTSTITALPKSVRDYIDKDHVWLTEAGINSEVANDYTVKAGIVPLSYTEYKKYYKKIGYRSVENTFLRSSSSQQADRMLLTGDSGNGYSVKNSTNDAGNKCIHPVFWLDEEFFRNVKLDCAAVGKNVANMLKTEYTIDELYKAGYSEGDLEQMGVISAPEIDTLNISAEVNNPGYPVSVSYTTSDDSITADEINAYIKWYVSDTKEGEYSIVAGAGGNDWQIFNVCANKLIKAAVGNVFSNAIEVGPAAEKPTKLTLTDPPADTSEKYLFKLADDSKQTYILIDNARKGDRYQYLLMGKTEVGKGKFSKSDSQTKFDINNPDNIAYWLNNELLYKTSLPPIPGLIEIAHPERLPQAVKQYIDTEHVWLTEAGYNADIKNDYTFKAGLANMSYSEFKKYSDIIGYNDLEKTYLRSAYPDQADRLLHVDEKKNGTRLNSVPATYASQPIKPVFWVWDDLFKNVKLDVQSMGSEVKKAMLKTVTRSEAQKAGYSDEELTAIGYDDLSAYAESVVISGDIAVGQRLAARYIFNDNGLSKTEGVGTIYQWYISDLQDGNFTAISGADSAHYIVKEEDMGKFLKVSVIPFDNEGNICEKGVSASTSAVRAPLDISARFVSFTNAAGDAINSVGSNTSITAKFEIENNRMETASMVIVVAVYNEDNMMVAVHSQTINAVHGVNEYTSTVDGFKAGNYKAKALVLENLDSLKPLSVDERL